MRLRTFLGMLALIIVTGLSAQAYRLTYKGTAGTVHTYTITTKATSSSTMQGSNIDTTNSMTMTEVEKVLSVKDGKQGLSYELKDGKMTMKLSGTPDAKPMDTPIPAMSFTFDPRAFRESVQYRIRRRAGENGRSDDELVSFPHALPRQRARISG